jgi:hypothetical protein
MDSSIHRLCVDQVLEHPDVPENQKLALRCFLKSWHGQDDRGEWMRAQDGWKEAAALLASASCEAGSFQFPRTGQQVTSKSRINPYRILMCSFGRKLCERGDHCRRCALDRIDLAWSEFLPAWEKGKHWYALVLAMDRRAEHAGIHRGDGTLDPKTSSIPVYQPYKGGPNGSHPLHSGAELEHIVDAIRAGFFDTAKAICDRGIVSGAFARFELSFTFWRGCSNYDNWSHLRHRVEPQLNLLVNSPRPLHLGHMKKVYKVMFGCLGERLPADSRWSYPDLWFAPVLDQKGMATWLGYMLKSWRVDSWYRDALNRRCNRRELNLCFDEIVFANGHRLARPKNSTRRYGNLHFNPHRPGDCIAQRVPKPPTQDEIKLLKDDKYAAANPDLVDAMLFWAEKRRKRRGRNRDTSEIIEY